MTKYIIRDSEAGNKIDEFDDLEAAEQELAAYEMQDKKDGTFISGFYEIIEQN